VACGDVNGDNVADIIAGAPRADPNGAESGEVYVFYGGEDITDTLVVDLSTDSPDVLLRGAAAGDEAGFYVAAGDVNGDGTGDLLITAYYADAYWPDSETGTAYVVYGSGSLTPTIELSSEADVTIHGAARDDRLGRALASGDFNDDGFDDLLIGASRADPAGRADAGISYVIYGAQALSSTIALSETNAAAMRVLGDDDGDEAGRAAGTGDLDGDGSDDLIVGAVLAATHEGETYVIQRLGAASISVEPSVEIEQGDRVTFTVMAANRFAHTWDVSTDRTTYEFPPDADYIESGNVFTIENQGVWVVTATHKGLTATTTITVNAPTAVHLAAFGATWRDGQVLVAWETAVEVDTVGFDLWRGESADGVYVRVNELLIPSVSPGGVSGGHYAYLDTGVTAGETYYYKLQELEADGGRNWYGPVLTDDSTPNVGQFRVLLPLVIH
jgi:hypothetical protein